ncbi:glycosyltransferase family 2 protein [Candidatus Parcubacteria bacterium]|nr:MAG: glycosyltransferase family 2 protein [Candidatus Parcubacteria bacterium]
MLSILIITKNEENSIGDCLKSIKDLADEIIVIDSYSSDKTVETAKEYGVSILLNRFEDFSKQRNVGFDSSKGDWILYLDADEEATEEFNKEIKKTIKDFDPTCRYGGYYVRRKTYFLNKDWDYSDKVQRLFYRKSFRGWSGMLHETPRVQGEFGEISSPILHFTHKNLSQMLEKTNEWSDYEADLRIKAKHPKMNILRFIRVIGTGFLDSYVKQNGYKNGTKGFIESMYQAFSLFITYAKLWEKQEMKK